MTSHGSAAEIAPSGGGALRLRNRQGNVWGHLPMADEPGGRPAHPEQGGKQTPLGTFLKTFHGIAYQAELLTFRTTVFTGKVSKPVSGGTPRE